MNKKPLLSELLRTDFPNKNSRLYPANIIFSNLTYSACVGLSGVIERPAFIVEGKYVDLGSDGELLLYDCVIKEELTMSPDAKLKRKKIDNNDE
jgi:hypothetical protein